MARAGLGSEKVTREALRLVDETGISALSIATLAARLGVKRPSLYNHVSSIEGLRESMRVLVLGEVAVIAEEAGAGKGREGFFTVMRALRDYVIRHPRRIELLLESAEGGTKSLRQSSQRLMRQVSELLGSYGLSGARAIHAARMLRALWLGFALIQARGGYAMDVAVEDSYTFALEAIHGFLSARPGKSVAAPRRTRPLTDSTV